MELNQNVYRDLCRLRDQLKTQGRRSEGRAPTVCTDDALFEIARLMPQREEDFLNIAGLGQTFVEKYSSAFLAAILKHVQKTAPKSQDLSDSTRQTLRELEKKLVNINRRNRLLYMSKITNKYAYDLFDPEKRYDPLDIIFSGKEIQICNISDVSTIRGQSGEEKYKRLVPLLREVNKDKREKGQFDLYVGYPFVSGRLLGENFDVRAPLILFPVEVTREAQAISIRLDESKDIVYNNNLILAHFKFNDLNHTLPSNIVEDITRENHMRNMIAFYSEEGISLKSSPDALKKFNDYFAGEFPQYSNGKLEIENAIVLGKFPTYGSALQKDFNDILESGEINELLANLLTGIDDIDYYDDSYTGEQEHPDETAPLTISEHDLTYIGDLNSSQEHVINAIKHQDALVVQGPPGTGKSQTITSLISDCVNHGQRVLMVSEKKAALDVVYSRLGELNKYALMIDDTNNKQGFYQQVEQMLNLHGLRSNPDNQLQTTSDAVDGYIRRLETIAQKLYSMNDFGIEVYKLYLSNRRIDLSNSEEEGKYHLLKSRLSDGLFALDYNTLHACYVKYKNRHLADNVCTFWGVKTKTPWIFDMRDDLSEYDISQCKQEATAVSAAIEEWRQKNFFARLFTKKKVGMLLDAFTQQYFLCFSAEQKKLFLAQNFEVAMIANYSDAMLAKPVYEALGSSEALYGEMIMQVASALACDLSIANEELFNLLICDYLFQFEAKNREVLQHVSNFNGIIDALSSAISDKKKITRQLLEGMLWSSLSNVVFSKRHGEIARVVDSKRRWSVHKFISKFSFELFRGIKIWLMTPEVASELLPLETGLFDLVIFDEASQMYVEKGVPAILRAKKVVIAGDSKQLRPSNLGAGRVEIDEDLPEDYEGNAALEEESLLDVARFKYIPPVTLNYHYRSQYEELIAFSNYAFYKGRLYVSPNVSATKPPIEVHKIEDGLWTNRSNLSEARKVIELLQTFFHERQANETIGIITFNSSQRDLIEDLIDAECARDQVFSAMMKGEISRTEDGEDIGLFVKNIENVQGDERDVIFFSIGYAKNENGRLVRNFGWLNQKGGENRLNVAISRAKKKVVIVTSFEPQELQVEDAKNEGPKLLRKYLEYAFAVSRKDKETARQILLSFGDTGSNEMLHFDSDFENQVYDALVARGYTVETQIGIGGYSIDLAIKQEDRYVLGIECDGKLYHSSKSARERDYHRQKYLESRGWAIHRIWSTNWWKSPSKEIDKIEAVLKALA